MTTPPDSPRPDAPARGDPEPLEPDELRALEPDAVPPKPGRTLEPDELRALEPDAASPKPGRTLEDLGETRALDEAPPSAETPPAESEPESELGQGDFVGRYSVLSRLGRGGMGVVYKAYDPQLDRNVALKLLRRGRGSVKADLRLMREARTLAKLKHPNVVAVYDAGLTNHGVFIAMELVEGRTLSAWLDERRRAVRDVLDVFLAAGRGLVVAHQAGFVHRDFKPSNVIVGEDGLVKVLDFGLAHLVDDPDPPPKTTGETEPKARTERPTGRHRGANTREVFSTEAGAVMGTPAFMAPEQILDGHTDHRSEQFAFAMSLYVALYDRSPLGGETYEERRRSIAAGIRISERDLETSAHGEWVPPRIRRVIVRGLEADPQRRFDSMEQMLAAIASPRRRWGWAAMAFTLMLGFGVGAVVFGEEPEPPCLDPGTALEGVWGSADRETVQDAFAQYSRIETRASLGRVEQVLDEYAGAWVKMYGQSCRATFVEHQQSQRLFDQRMRCLERRRNRLRSTIDALVGAPDEPQLIQRTILAYKLPPIDVCADVEHVTAEQPLPEDPAARERIAALRRRIDDINTRREAREVARGVEQMTDVVEEARELDYGPLLGEALESLGRAQIAVRSFEPAEQAFREAITVAEGVGDDRTSAAAWTGMVFAWGWTHLEDDPSILKLAAQAAVDRARDETIQAWLLNELGVLHGRRDELEVALEYLRQALAVKLERLGPEHVDVGIARFNLGHALIDPGSYAEAEQELTRAHAIFEATVGSSHPMTLVALKVLCRVDLAQGDVASAESRCRAARSGYRSLDSPKAAEVGLMLAQAQWRAGEQEAARTTAQEAKAEEHADQETIEKLERWLEDPDAYERAELQDPDGTSRGPVQSAGGSEPSPAESDSGSESAESAESVESADSATLGDDNGDEPEPSSTGVSEVN